MHATKWLAWVLAGSAATLAACNSITGVNDLTFDRPSSATGGTSGGGASGGASGSGTGGACTLHYKYIDDNCTSCLSKHCCNATQSCENDIGCVDCLTGGDACAQNSATTLQFAACVATSCSMQCKFGSSAGGMSGVSGAGGTGATMLGPNCSMLQACCEAAMDPTSCDNELNSALAVPGQAEAICGAAELQYCPQTSQGGAGMGGTGSGTGGGSGSGGAASDCAQLSSTQCRNCCSTIPEAPPGASEIAGSCACEAQQAGCAGPTGCGDLTTCMDRWDDALCENCQDFQDCLLSSCPVNEPGCLEFDQCLTGCPVPG